MNPCDEYRIKTLRYLDDDLQGRELIDFHNHLKACAACLASLEAEQALSYLLHRSRPLYLAPATLRSRVSAAVMQHSELKLGRAGSYQGALQMLERELVHLARRLLSMRELAFVALLLALLFAFVPNVVRQVRAASFVETAVTAHRSYLNGNRPLGLRSSSPELVTIWFTGQVPFHFQLPNAQSARTGHLTTGSRGRVL